MKVTVGEVLALILLVMGIALGLVVQMPDSPTILVGTGCGPNKQTMHFAEEDQFPSCEKIERIRG